ncbi:hypothetical protein [Neobacillus sp. D3-1R]|uniref:hypothetical protein n=1 Tax=Neobacillus sp. D3-1R TaxID=3445778 RepID=UPI003FA0B6D0
MSYLFAAFSVILLLPLVLILNIGISKKGKILITVSSFILATLALFGQLSYSFWQIGLIIVLLIMLLSYLFIQRFEKLIFETNQELKYVNNPEIVLIFEEETEDSPLLDDIDIQTTSINQENNNEILEPNLSITEELSIREEVTPLVSNLNEELIAEEQINLDDLIETLIFNQNESLPQELDESLFEEKLSNYTVVDEKEIIEWSDFEGNRENNLENHESQIDYKEDFSQLFESDLEEITPFELTKQSNEEEEKIKIIEIDEDVIIPIKDFVPLDTGNDSKEKIKKEEKPDKKETYLAEIEKLLEED